MKKKLIVISGATSSLMNAVIDNILQRDEYLVCGITTNLEKVSRNDIKWVECDLASQGNDYSFMENAHILIHAAALSNAYNRQDFLDVNLGTTRNLVEQAKKYDVKRFIYISSVLACENCGDYGYSKLMAEQYIKSHFKNYTIVRPSQLYGYSETSPIDSLIRKIKSGKIIPCPTGDYCSLFPLHYLDASREIYRLALSEGNVCSEHFIIGPKAYNFRTLINEISTSVGRKAMMIKVPKTALTFLRKLIEITGIRAGIYPDQIYRLYHPNNNIKAPDADFGTLAGYLRNQ